MRRCLALLLTMQCLPDGGGRSAGAESLVSRLHVVSVHVPDHATFDAVYVFFRDTLGLPVVYGKPGGPGDEGRRLYAGFSVGNAYLEPCGPYATDAPFTPSQPARFHGLTFLSDKPIADVAADLDRRGIDHSEVIGPGSRHSFIYVRDDMLTGTKQAVSFWELRDADDASTPARLEAMLQAAGGGPLGIRCLREVWIELPGEAHRRRWERFLGSGGDKGEVWPIGKGPALRPFSGDGVRLQGIVLAVASLEDAQRHLSKIGLKTTPESRGLALDPAKSFGLRILLTADLDDARAWMNSTSVTSDR